MKRVLIIFALLILQVVFVNAIPAEQLVFASPTARTLVESAIEAMGGLERLQSIKTLQFKANGHQFLLEQSERPAGPWLIAYRQISETRDLEKGRVSQEITAQNPGTAQASNLTTIVADNVAAVKVGDNIRAFSMAQVEEAEESIALSPERVLLTALAAKDLRLEKSEMLQDVRHNVIAFTWKNAPVKVFLNADTNLPTAVEIIRARPFDAFWNVWGDFPTRTYFSFWMLETNGLHYPHQWDVERNNQPLRSLTISELKINPEIQAQAFTVPDDVRQAFAARGATKINDLSLGLPNAPAKEIVPNFIQIPGRWNIAIIKQTDGIIILEAPISSGYSAKVVEEVARRFPGAKIKAVISTSDSFPHLGGLREYIGRGVPAYILDVNQPIVERLLNAEYRTFPDALAKNGRRAKLNIVRTKTVVGIGANRLELYPIRSETGERMMMVYAPEYHLLYGSDMVQPQPDGTFFMLQYISELVAAAKRESLRVEKVFAMHSEILTWSSMEKALEPKQRQSTQN